MCVKAALGDGASPIFGRPLNMRAPAKRKALAESLRERFSIGPQLVSPLDRQSGGVSTLWCICVISWSFAAAPVRSQINRLAKTQDAHEFMDQLRTFSDSLGISDAPPPTPPPAVPPPPAAAIHAAECVDTGRGGRAAPTDGLYKAGIVSCALFLSAA